jgi:hypothetical protein
MAVCNIIHFLSDPVKNEMYFDRVQKYLQPTFVRWNFFADTAEAFTEITKHPESQWHILVTDPVRLQDDLAMIRAFAIAKPSCTIAVLGSNDRSAVELPKLKPQPDPQTLDDWLGIMHGLIGNVE